MYQNDNDIAQIDALSADQMGALLIAGRQEDSFLGLRPNDILSVPGVASLISPHVLTRMNAPATTMGLQPGDEDAEAETELRVDQAACALTKVVDLMAAQTKVMSPEASTVTVLGHAERRLEEAMQQFALDLMALGAAVLSELGRAQLAPTQ